MFNIIKSIEDTKGKRVIETVFNEVYIGFLYSDKSFILFRLSQEWEHADLELIKEIKSSEILDDEFLRETLISLRVISPQVLSELKEQRENEIKAANKELRDKKRAKEYEKYLEFKKKFEKVK